MLQTATTSHPPIESHPQNDRYPGFRGGVCRMPIRYRHRWHRDLLLQAALDPAVDEMGPSELAIPGCLVFMVRQANQRALVIGVHDDAPPQEMDGPLPFLHVTRTSTLIEPLLTSARAVWATRHRPIPASDRIRILTAFDERAEIQLRELAGLVRPPADGVDVVFGMACSGELSISLAKGIRPEMGVKRRQPGSTDIPISTP